MFLVVSTEKVSLCTVLKKLYTFRVFFFFLKVSLKTAEVSQLLSLVAFCSSFASNIQPPPNTGDQGFVFLRVLHDTYVLDHNTQFQRSLRDGVVVLSVSHYRKDTVAFPTP